MQLGNTYSELRRCVTKYPFWCPASCAGGELILKRPSVHRCVVALAGGCAACLGLKFWRAFECNVIPKPITLGKLQKASSLALAALEQAGWSCS